MSALYTAEATATEGRSGRVRSSDGRLDVQLVVPPEMGGSGGDGTNPEQLFAAGFAACFGSAVNLIGSKRRLDMEGAAVHARVSLGPRADGSGVGLAVELAVALPKLTREQAEHLVARAETVCPYSLAVKGNVPVSVTISSSE